MEHMRNIILRKEIYQKMLTAWNKKADFPEGKLIGSDGTFVVRFSSDTDICKHDCFALTALNDLLSPDAKCKMADKWIKLVIKAAERHIKVCLLTL